MPCKRGNIIEIGRKRDKDRREREKKKRRRGEREAIALFIYLCHATWKRKSSSHHTRVLEVLMYSITVVTGGGRRARTHITCLLQRGVLYLRVIPSFASPSCVYSPWSFNDFSRVYPLILYWFLLGASYTPAVSFGSFYIPSYFLHRLPRPSLDIRTFLHLSYFRL